jgi:hypothetical protein
MILTFTFETGEVETYLGLFTINNGYIGLVFLKKLIKVLPMLKK